MSIPWIIRDNCAHDILEYDIDDPVRDAELNRDPVSYPLYGVQFMTYTREQRDQICRLIEEWNVKS